MLNSVLNLVVKRTKTLSIVVRSFSVGKEFLFDWKSEEVQSLEYRKLAFVKGVSGGNKFRGFWNLWEEAQGGGCKGYPNHYKLSCLRIAIF